MFPLASNTTPQGAQLIGKFDQIIFNSKSDTFSGTFNATDCDLSSLNPDAPVLCN